ncbi:MAG: carboxypeptidase-like regulatory domain-containing protein, partial [bacterium]
MSHITLERSFRRHVPIVFSLAWTLLLPATPATARQGQDASIIGQVTDDSGAVLPGVTVTATSPALQVPQVISVTNERGEYRLTPLPIGTYAVQYELAGFGTLRRQDIRLTAGFTARVDVALNVGALEETITVTGAAPVVDVASTSATTQLTREALDLIPTGRTGLQSALVQAPGVRT